MYSHCTPHIVHTHTLMLRIGLTGGIGSGKSTVAGIFEVLGIPVYYADVAAKKLMNESEVLKAALQKEFGKDIYSNGRLDRKLLGEKVFNDKKKLDLLNSIVHPVTIEDAEKWISQQTSPYIIKEAALLFESGSNKYLDFIIGVSAPLQLRIERTIARGEITYEQVTARMNKQMDEETKLSLCDYIITNDEQQLLLPQALKLHQQFMLLSK
ncbi:MAG: dephospho-CoA kinase [Ginsengibacter sp.]